MFGVFVILLFLTFVAAKYASSQYQAALREGLKRGMPGGQTAADAVRDFLGSQGITHVQIREHTALNSNYYDSRRKTLFLTREVLNGTDAASWAIALHEAAHALQTSDSGKAYLWRLGNIRLTKYVPAVAALVCLIFVILKRIPFRTAFMICSSLWAVIMLGNVMSIPVEFNASRRALVWLEQRLAKYPDTLGAMQPILQGVAWRDTGIFFQSPLYCLFGLLPVGGKLRPR